VPRARWHRVPSPGAPPPGVAQNAFKMG
jgi:hypothetical protein